MSLAECPNCFGISPKNLCLILNPLRLLHVYSTAYGDCFIHFISVYLCSQSSVKCVVSSSTIVVKNVFFSFFLRLFLLTLLTRRLTFFFTPEGCHTHRPQSHSRVVPYDHVRSYIVRFTYMEWITHSSLPNCEVGFRISKINVFIEFEAFSILIL
jgi:hypothetical protein